jgi:hypothetical protein
VFLGGPSLVNAGGRVVLLCFLGCGLLHIQGSGVAGSSGHWHVLPYQVRLCIIWGLCAACLELASALGVPGVWSTLGGRLWGRWSAPEVTVLGGGAQWFLLVTFVLLGSVITVTGHPQFQGSVLGWVSVCLEGVCAWSDCRRRSCPPGVPSCHYPLYVAWHECWLGSMGVGVAPSSQDSRGSDSGVDCGALW